jgi:hypothetical protein
VALQIRRGTEAERSSGSFIPLLGEPVFTTDEKKLYVGDGSTAGGISVGKGQRLGDLSDVVLESDTVRTITSIAIASNVAIVTTVEPHGFSTGDTINIQVTGQSSVNGLQVLTGITAITFTFAFASADLADTADVGTATFRAADESILAFNQTTGVFGEQDFVYNLDGLGDVEVDNVQDQDIIQAVSTAVGDITLDVDATIVSSAVVDPGSAIPAGQTWTQTGVVTKFKNQPFRISFSNINDTLIVPSTLANNQILAYDSTLNFWVNKHYVNSFEDLNDVVTNLPSAYETEYAVTVDGLYVQEDVPKIVINDRLFQFAITMPHLQEAESRAIANGTNLDTELRIYIAELLTALINADTELSVVATQTANRIVFTDSTSTSIRIHTLIDQPVTDNFDPTLTLAIPTPSQVLMHDGTNWINGGFSFNNFNINALYDVSLINPADGDIIQYNNATGFWENSSNFISLTQFNDVEIGSALTNDAPTGGEAIIYDTSDTLFKVKKFELTDLDDVSTDMGLGFVAGVVPDGSVLAYDTGLNRWHPKQFSTIASRNVINIFTNPTEALGIAEVDFDAFTGYGILKIQTVPRATVTFYTNAFARTQDLNRAHDAFSPPNSGIFSELTPPDENAHQVAPIVYGFNDDIPISRRAYAKVRNRSGFYSSSIQITLTLLQIEDDPPSA